MTANPEAAPGTSPTSFADLGLLPDLLRAISEEGYTEPTPIQRQAIPSVLARRDIMGSAQTGTGKTASFALPILQLLFPHASNSPSPARHPVRALVLTPTRELAVQVETSFRTYGKHVPLRTAVVYGGVDMDPQIKAFHGGIEIVVATPGRLLDHVRNKTANLSRVEILVLDEADRMLDMGFMPDIKRILQQIPPQRQNLLFSATFSDDIRKLAGELLSNPVIIEVAPRNTAAETISHKAYAVSGADKRRLLSHLVKTRDMKQVLVFTRTRLGANRLARELERDGINATAIHSNRTQAEREKALADFKNGDVRVLVATDVASRGIDIEDLPIVVNYELPYAPEDYVHRIGRTGRAGSSGEAISLVEADEQKLLADIERLLKRPIPKETMPLPDDRDSRRQSDRRPREAGRAETPASPRPHRSERPARAAVVASDGFDFSKPYEPSTPAAADTDSTKAPLAQQPARGKRARQIGVLLGGILPK